MKLATRDDFKKLMGWSADQNGELIDALLVRATALAEQLVGRRLTRELEITEFPTPTHAHSTWLALDRAPIEHVDSLSVLGFVGSDADHDEADTLTEDVDFVVSAPMGKLKRIDATWPKRARSIRVIYTAGFVDPAIEEPPESAIQPPHDLQNGILQQAIRMWQTKDTAGVHDVALPQGGRMSLTEAKPHPALLAACSALRRLI